MWECLHCGESVEEVFAVCWKCQANRDGTPSVLQDPPRDEQEEDEIAALDEWEQDEDEEDEEDEIADPDEEDAPIDCLRCEAEMNYAGTGDFHERPALSAWPKRTRLRMYVCPDCLHVEFFALAPNP